MKCFLSNNIKISKPRVVKIWNQTFYEEYEEFKDILANFEKKDLKIKILDLGSWNWRMNILVNEILKPDDFDFLWIDNQQSDPQYSQEFLAMSIENAIYKLKRDSFDLIILSWIFTNFLEFSKDNIAKIKSLLKNNWIVYISFWNYWDQDGLWKLYRSEDLWDLKKYIDNKIIPVLNELDLKADIKLYKKNSNTWYNIVIRINT